MPSKSTWVALVACSLLALCFSPEQACAATASGVYCWGDFVDADGGSVPTFLPRSMPLAGPVLQLSAATRGYVGTHEEHLRIPVHARTASGDWKFEAGWIKSKPRAAAPLRRREPQAKVVSPDGLCGIGNGSFCPTCRLIAAGTGA